MKKINIYELMANLLIVLLSALGIIKSLEWIIRRESSLQKVSELYTALSNYVDIGTLGWFLFLASVILLVSIFMQGKGAYICMLIGGLGAGAIFILFGMISVENAGLFTTYYSNMLQGIFEFILACIGGLGLWQNKAIK